MCSLVISCKEAQKNNEESKEDAAVKTEIVSNKIIQEADTSNMIFFNQDYAIS